MEDSAFALAGAPPTAWNEERPKIGKVMALNYTSSTAPMGNSYNAGDLLSASGTN